MIKIHYFSTIKDLVDWTNEKLIKKENIIVILPTENNSMAIIYEEKR